MKPTMRRTLILMLFVTLAAGCQEPMEQVGTISKFRVLAVQAEPPEAAPGETVTHRVLYADPQGEGRKVSFLWITCLELFTPSSDMSGGCEMLGFGTGDASTGGEVYETFPIPESALDLLKEEKYKNRSYIPATTILSLCAGGELPDMTELASESSSGLPDLNELCTGGEGLTAFKTFRISAAETPDRNTNPQIDHMVFNGNRLYPLDPATGEILAPPLDPDQSAEKCENDNDCPSGEASKIGSFVCDTTSECLDGVPLKAYLTDESFEFYSEKRSEGTVQVDEAPYISWFMDGGEISAVWSRTSEPPGPFKATWAPPQKGGKFTLYVVAHDLRGGTGWQQFAVEAVTGYAE